MTLYADLPLRRALQVAGDLAVVLWIWLCVEVAGSVRSRPGRGGGVPAPWLGLVGALVGFIFARTRSQRQQRRQLWLLIAVAAGLCALLVIPVVVYG